MRVRLSWLALWCCLGCHSFFPIDPEPPATAPEAGSRDAKPHAAIDAAIASLEGGDDDQACNQLARYLADFPDHSTMRARRAELLLKLRHITDARAEFEKLVATTQDEGPMGRDLLIHAHARLVAIAEMLDDDYASSLNRGIGLYLLGVDRSALGKEEGDCSAESLFCKAAGELMSARRQQTQEARPCWYLHLVWARLGQNQPAQRWMHAAEDAAPFTDLTPGERRAMTLARTARLP